MLYQQAKKELETIFEQICSLENQLETFPPGKLICCNHNTKTKWYHKNQGKRVYIPKSNRKLAEQLAQKKILIISITGFRKRTKSFDHVSKSSLQYVTI